MPSFKPALSCAVSLAVLAGLGVTATPPAAAAEQDAPTAAVTALFTRLANDFLPQVASSTALSEQLPTLAVTPAGSVGLRTAFSDALGPTGRLKDLSGQLTLAQLASYVDGQDGGGWVFTTSHSAGSVTVGFTRTVADEDAGLDVRDPDGTLSLSTGGGIKVTGTLEGSFTFVHDPASEQAVLTNPAMTIKTTADLPAGKQLDAGLGILGVKVVGTAGTADYNLASTVTTGWANPDSDAAASLAFDNPATPAAGDGELSADGAGTGLVTATRSGTLAAQLVAEPRSSTLVAGLPTVGATVTVTSDSPGTFDAPAVTAVVPEAAEPFLTLTPRDLAAGLSQAASAVIGMQDAEDARLPLMRGSIGNAVDAVGGIKAFLADQVPDADPEDSTPGQPKFASLQDMLAALDSASYPSSGWSIDVLGGDDAASFDAEDEVLDFAIRTTRGGVSDLELNILGAATTGTADYSATGLDAVAGEVDLDGPKGTSGSELVGRKVTAGTSYGTIAEVVDANTLTLTAEGWSAGEPTDGSAFSIEAADPKTGAPELADTLLEDTGIEAANADLSTATVTPTVDVTLPLALDLSAPLTYTEDGVEIPDCDPGDGTAPCPFQQVDASGLARVITSLPLASDRILLRQSERTLLVADADISSPVQIQTSSGFLALSVGGSVKLTVPDGEHLQTLALTGTGDIPIPAFVEQVRQQAVRETASDDDVFHQTLDGSVSATVVVSVDDAPDAFADGVDSTSLTLQGSVRDLADGIDDGEVAVTPAEPARAELLAALNFEPGNPTSLFGGVQAALEEAGSSLTALTGGGLDTPIPFVGTSVSQLIGGGASGAAGVTYTQQPGSPAVPATGSTPEKAAVPATTLLTDVDAGFEPAFIGRRIVIGSTIATIVGQTANTLVVSPQLTSEPADDTPYLVENELLGAVHVLQAMTPATLQETIAMAESSLGNGSTIDFGLIDGDAGAQLRLDLTWERAYGVSRPVSLELSEGQELTASAGGELALDASGTVQLRLLLPLTAAAMLEPLDNTRVDQTESSVELDISVAADDAHMGASLGPVSLDLGTAKDPGSIQAGFGVEITGGTAEDVPSVADFFTTAFDVTVTNGGAECASASTVLCADFPIYVNGAKPPPTTENLTLTTTLGSGEDLEDVFGDASTEVVLPSGLQKIIDGTAFKFDTLAQGLQQYLFYSEAALRTAANHGELPVIGKDLQAGADFMGDTRVEIDNFMAANGDPTTVGGAKKLLQEELAKALDIPVGGPTGVQVGFTCTATLDPPTPAPTATATGAASGDTTSYVYKVVSTFTDKKSVVHDSIPSAATTPAVTNAAAPATGKSNTVSWTKTASAMGYKVLRATQTTAAGSSTPTTSAYVLVGSVTGNAVVTFVDTLAPGTAYVEETKAYARVPGATCADTTSVLQIEGVTLGLVMGQGKVSNDKGCENDAARGDCLGAELPVDLGLPGLSLKTGEGGSVSGKVGWALDVQLGLSRSAGFYIETKDTDEFEVGASLGLDQSTNAPDLTAQLSVITVDVEKNAPTTPEFVGHFGIDIMDDAKDLDSFLTLGEMARLKVSDAIKVSVDAKVDINWHLAASADAALPGVSTDFKLTWGWGASTGASKPAAPGNTDGLKIRFEKVTLDAGEFFGEALKPYLVQLEDATKPLQPIIDTIFTPMPVISDLSRAAGGQAVTIASLAETFNTLPQGARIKPFLDAIKLVKKLQAVKCSTTCGVEIGSFDLSAKRVATTNATAGNAGSMIEKKTPVPGASSAIANKDTSNQLASGGTPKLDALRSVISIPVIDDPTILFGLISGGDIPLVEFDSGPLSLGFQFQKSFGPIYAPPPVMMVIGGGASVTLRVAAGFDTYGIRRAIETGDGAQVLDSLYFKTVDDNGVPIPVVQFTGYLEAGASVSLGILEVGVVGGIKLTVGFYWNDPNNDGKFRLFEFSAAVATNPICLFNVGGELSLYIKVFVVIGFSPFAVDFNFTLVNIKLLDFNLKPDCTPPPPRLGGTSGKTLYVFAGKLGGSGPRGHTAWAANDEDETWVVRQVPAYTDDDGAKVPAAVEIRGLGITESFPDPDGTAIDTVVLDARDYGGALTVSFTGGAGAAKDEVAKPFDKTAVVFTGNGEDVIRTGEGTSWVDSGGGADNVTTLDRTDLTLAADSVSAHVAGGGGADVITVGNGKDTVTGDGSLALGALVTPEVSLAPVKAGKVTLPAVLNPSTVADPAPADLYATNPANSGADQIAAGLGKVVLSGNGGNDTIGTANDNTLAESVGIKAGTQGGSAAEEALYRARSSVLVGGAGSDVLKSGSADDEVYTGSHDTIGESGTGAGDASGDVNTVDTGTGSDKVYGSNGQDFVTTSSTATPLQSATVYGGAGSDVLTGGLGADKIYGGPDDDYVVAAPATVGAPSSTTDVLGPARDVEVLAGAGSSEKTLVGGTGSDRIYGADGPSLIYGDTTVDTCDPQSDPVSSQPKETVNTLDAADLVLGGLGVDIVNAGGGADWVYASGAADRVCGNAGADKLYAGADADLVHGGSGSDQGFGEAGADQVYGNDDADALYGATDEDRLQGNKGDDWVDGGSEADVLLGGTSAAARPDGSDVVLGAGGTDVLVGDNATSDVNADAPYPTDLGSDDATRGGPDFLVGGDDDDHAFGGLGNDTTYGGSGDDVIEGNLGSDSIWGEAGDDDVVGGSSQLASGLFSGSEPGRADSGDVLDGGTGQDVVAGDNARITRGGSTHPVTTGRGLVDGRAVDLADESSGDPSGVAGGDAISTGGDVDVVFGQRGDDDISLGDGADYGEGGPGVDLVHGDTGHDDVVGGSFTPALQTAPSPTGQPDGGDTLAGDAGQDVVLGDNGSLTRALSTGLVPVPTTGTQASALTAGRVDDQRSIAPYDLGGSAAVDASGADTITGGTDNDVLLGQDGHDSVDGGTEADYAEGGQGSDLVLGGTEDDDVVGGSSSTTAPGSTSGVGQPDGADNVYGGAGSDLLVGDNGLVTRADSSRDWRTNRSDAAQAALVPGRRIALLDLNGPVPALATTANHGPDALSGQDGVDVLLGQDGADRISGGGHDDYAEGEGGGDHIHGDAALAATDLVPAPAGAAWATAGTDPASVTEGQDDLAGGSSRAGHRDGADVIHGDGEHDFVIGDNGSVARVLTGSTEAVYAKRYGTGRTGDAKVRVAGGGASSTRFCTAPPSPSPSSTCEVPGSYGADELHGDGGQDVLYGQDAGDTIRGGSEDDDIYGELGGDVLFGEDGEDAILGDRGGVQNRYEDGSRSATTTLSSPPAVTLTTRRAGSVSRESDLLHDVNGMELASGAPMPLDGITFGGLDRIRGGAGNDSIHAGAGDDLVNGDSGGDAVFGGRGKDVLWGGLGKVCAVSDTACLADPGPLGEHVDHLAGGKDEDVIDWRPRGVYGTGATFSGRTCSTSTVPTTTKKDGTTDPCTWFEMTDRANDVTGAAATSADNQHHQGVDWMYGGWDRDVMQGDLSQNGPNPGDRLIDWNGVYNLYSHCNAAYGGYNDIRIPSPSLESFLRDWATGMGAGRPGGSGAAADVGTAGTSAYDELALVYNGDGKAHGSGSAYPTTPGHFDNAGACDVF